jgi:hypothetical protein
VLRSVPVAVADECDWERAASYAAEFRARGLVLKDASLAVGLESQLGGFLSRSAKFDNLSPSQGCGFQWFVEVCRDVKLNHLLHGFSSGQEILVNR